MSGRSRIWMVSVSLAATMACGSTASAATRYAAVTGVPTGACDSAHPCSITHAIAVAATGDEVVVRPGTYSPGAGLEAQSAINLHGIDGVARPRIVVGGTDWALRIHGGSLSHVEVVQSGTGGAVLGQATDMRDVVASASTNSGLYTLRADGDATVRDVVAWAKTSGTAFLAVGGKVSVRNLTAWSASGAGAAVASSQFGTASLELRNTVARGATEDVLVQSQSGYAAIVTLRHDNFASVTETGSNTAINDLGDNQSVAPQFASPATGNFHQQPTSPTIDAGSSAGLVTLGPVDIDGDQRVVGSPDIGADEYTLPPGVVTGPPTLVGSTVATVQGSVNPHGGLTSYLFEWGKTTAYGNPPIVLFPPSAGNGFAPVPLSLKLTGLTPSTTYHYRLRARNASGLTLGQDATVRTGPPGTPDPGGSGPQPGLPGGAILTLTNVSMRPARFRVARGRTALSARRRPVPRGTTFRWRLSEPATVTIALRRKLAGRRRGRRCVKPTRALRRARRCTRLVTRATLTRRSPLGASAGRFTGRAGRRKLAPGRYAAVLRARDAAGNRSKARTLAFTVVAG